MHDADAVTASQGRKEASRREKRDGGLDVGRKSGKRGAADGDAARLSSKGGGGRFKPY